MLPDACCEWSWLLNSCNPSFDLVISSSLFALKIRTRPEQSTSTFDRIAASLICTCIYTHAHINTPAYKQFKRLIINLAVIWEWFSGILHGQCHLKGLDGFYPVTCMSIESFGCLENHSAKYHDPLNWLIWDGFVMAYIIWTYKWSYLSWITSVAITNGFDVCCLCLDHPSDWQLPIEGRPGTARWRGPGSDLLVFDARDIRDGPICVSTQQLPWLLWLVENHGTSCDQK